MMFLQLSALPLLLVVFSPIQALRISLPNHALSLNHSSISTNTSNSGPLPNPYRIPHTDLALSFPEPWPTPECRPLTSYDARRTFRLAKLWLVAEVTAHGDRWVPAFPDKTEFIGLPARLVFVGEEDPSHTNPSMLRYTDVIGVLRGIQTKMEREGFFELEALIQDSNVEDRLGTVAVIALDSKDGVRGTE